MRHPHRIKVAKHPLRGRERQWVDEILQHHPLWSDVDVSETLIVAQCGCGECRTIYLNSDKPQNPTLKGTHGYIGKIEIRTASDFGITITLDQLDGKLDELYINYVDLSGDANRPFPHDWEESAHLVQAM